MTNKENNIVEKVEPKTYFFTNTTGIISYFIILMIILGIYAAYYKQYPSNKLE
jgi:hypothetical protein